MMGRVGSRITGMALSQKQQRFVEEYLLDLNATQAYKRAGYKVKSDDVARAAAARLLATVSVQEAVLAAQSVRSERVQIDAAWVVEKLRENAAKAMNPVGEGKYEGGVANRAFELIGKHLGMFEDANSAAIDLLIERELARLGGEGKDKVSGEAEATGDPEADSGSEAEGRNGTEDHAGTVGGNGTLPG
jgi:phage terminase small subunit